MIDRRWVCSVPALLLLAGALSVAPAAAGLDDLMPLHTRRLDAGGGEQHRHHLVPVALRGGEDRDVVQAPGDTDRRQRTAAGTAIGVDQNPVSQVVADHRLYAVGEIGQQDRVGFPPRRHGAVALVDRLQYYAVRVEV